MYAFAFALKLEQRPSFSASHRFMLAANARTLPIMPKMAMTRRESRNSGVTLLAACLKVDGAPGFSTMVFYAFYGYPKTIAE